MSLSRNRVPAQGAEAVAVALAHIGKGFLLLSEAVEGLPKPEPRVIERVEVREVRRPMQMLDAGEVAARLKVPKGCAYKLMRSGALPSVSLGDNTRRVRECDLEAFVESRLDSANRIAS